MKNKTKAMTLLLTMAITAEAFSQQYDSESDFKVQRKDGSAYPSSYTKPARYRHWGERFFFLYRSYQRNL
ncbi:MAG: hypothetical protein LBU85_02160 [Treponema sp.]|jgi:hypothetical protein|nr:hypothetical protein [Treponema sp.]